LLNQINIFDKNNNKYMTAYIITIGDEILIGQTVNTNASWLGTQLSESNINIIETITIPDRKEVILDTLDKASLKADLVIVTGGLGPTKDDITKNCLCTYFNDTLTRNEEVLDKINSYFEARGLEMLDSNIQQADLPSKAEVVPNELGTASGMWFRKENTQYISLPGVPYEMKNMVSEYIIPKLKAKYNLSSFYHQNILIQGIGESFLAEKIKHWENDIRESGLNLAYLPSPGIIRLRISSPKGKMVKPFIDEKIRELKKTIPKHVVGINNDTLTSVLAKLLKYNKLSISTAESCTGGNIAKSITSLSGSSEYFNGTIVAYQNNIKSKVLDVDPELFKTVGAVSKEVVEQMAIGGKKVMNSTYCIATSGVSGPNGGTKEKPVGTTWIAISGPNKTVSKKFMFGENRERNITKATNAAINFLRIVILDL
jgi:nicotinamide-nucleotide amidase